jgi:hypothetical protein
MRTAATSVLLDSLLLYKFPCRDMCGTSLRRNAEFAFNANLIDEHLYHELLQFNKCNNIVKHEHYSRSGKLGCTTAPNATTHRADFPDAHTLQKRFGKRNF